VGVGKSRFIDSVDEMQYVSVASTTKNVSYGARVIVVEDNAKPEGSLRINIDLTECHSLEEITRYPYTLLTSLMTEKPEWALY